jgi:signal transduction histidine kinase
VNDPEVTRWQWPWTGYRVDQLDRAAAVLVVALIGVTLAVTGLRTGATDVVAPALDLVLDTIAALVMAAVAVLSWIRFAERHDTVALVQAAAFIPLGAAHAVSVIGHVMAGAAASVGPGGSVVIGGLWPLELAILSAGRLIAAATLVVGDLANLRGLRTRHPSRIVLFPATVLVAGLVAIMAAGDDLPLLVTSRDGVASTTALGAAVQLVSAWLTLVAAELSRRLWRRDQVIAGAYLALGLIVACFAQVHEVLFPNAESVHVATSDLLWLAFGLMLAVAIEAEARRTLGELRRANQTLERLKDAETERAALEERTKLSRELHDGLAQDLWLAKLKTARLMALPGLGAEAATLSAELDGAIEAGLAEARNAVETLRIVSRGTSSFRDVLAHSVEEFEDRFGVRAELSCPADLPVLAPRTESELLRIAQEALSNIARHADATLVAVEVQAADGRLRMTVRDNGRGFDPARVGDGHFGLAGMQERAALSHGELTIVSQPLDGTVVGVTVPVAPVGVPAAGQESAPIGARGGEFTP